MCACAANMLDCTVKLAPNNNKTTKIERNERNKTKQTEKREILWLSSLSKANKTHPNTNVIKYWQINDDPLRSLSNQKQQDRQKAKQNNKQQLKTNQRQQNKNTNNHKPNINKAKQKQTEMCIYKHTKFQSVVCRFVVVLLCVAHSLTPTHSPQNNRSQITNNNNQFVQIKCKRDCCFVCFLFCFVFKRSPLQSWVPSRIACGPCRWSCTPQQGAHRETCSK